MTIAELNRAFASKVRINKIEEQKKASFDYILADLIGRSMSRIYSSSAKFPPIEEVYPTLFDAAEQEEKAQIKKDELSVIRFKLFAEAHNKRFEGGKTEE